MPLNQPISTSHSPGRGWAHFALPSVADLIFLVLLFSLTVGAFAPRLLGDAGIGWHIRDGEQMLHTRSVTRTDSFSSTMSGQRWYAWEWLYDLLIAAMHHWMGLNGVVLFTALVVAGTFTLTLRWMLARGGNLPLAVILLALAVGASAIHLFARPHVLSWLFALIWFQLLDSWEMGSGQDHRLWWLPVLMVFWVNLHGGFLTGVMLLGIYLIGGLVQYTTATDRKQLKAKRLKHLSVITGFTLAATLVNPYSYELHSHIYQYLSNRFLMNHIEEFRSPDFHGIAQQCFAVLLVITLVALATARQKPRISQLLVIVFAAGSGLYASRNLPVSSILLVLIIGPILSQAFAEARTKPEMAAWLRNLFSRGESFAERMAAMETSQRGHLWAVAGVILALWITAHGGRLGSRRVMDAHFNAERFPVQATDQIAQRGIHEPIFCPDYWGGYLIYRLYPQNKVVVDDQHDLYGEQFLKEYLKVIHVEPGWEQALDGEHADWVLAPEKSALSNILKLAPQWKLVYEDDVAALFQRARS